MFTKYLSLALAVTFSSASVASQWVDLSQTLEEGIPVFPGVKPYTITQAVGHNSPEGFYVATREFSMSEHSGTHMDAPNHFAKHHSGVDQIPLSQLIGPAIMLDVRYIVKKQPDYLISIADFERWEKEYGAIPDGAIVLLNTGYARYWPNLKRYAGLTNTGEKHFPGLDPQAAEWLIKQKHIKAIGIDTFSIDRGLSKNYASHQILTQHNVLIFENVASMKKLPASHFTVIALPVKIKNGTAAPLRIIAKTDELS